MNAEETNQFFKAKRDQYLIQIRKQKNELFLAEKRMKLSTDVLGRTFPKTEIEIEQECNKLAEKFFDAYNEKDMKKLTEMAKENRIFISMTENPPLQYFVSTKIVPTIIGLLDYQYYKESELMSECAWILANISSGSSEYIQYLLELDIVDKAINLLDHPNEEVKSNSIWILANISGDNLKNRAILLEKGLVIKIENILDGYSYHPAFFGHLAWLISNLCRGKPYPDRVQIQPLINMIPVMFQEIKNEEVIKYLMWTVSYISDGDDNYIKEIFEMGVVEQILTYLHCENLNMVAPALRVVGNLVTATEDIFSEALLSLNIVPDLALNLRSPKKTLKKEACWCLSNLLAGPAHHIEEIYAFNNREIIQTLFHMVYNDSPDVAREAVFALANICHQGSNDQVKVLVEKDLIETLIGALRANSETVLVKACLDALESILNMSQQIYSDLPENPYITKFYQAEGADILNELQYHQNDEIFGIVERIIVTHFNSEPTV